MTGGLSIAKALKAKLNGDNAAKLDRFAEALLDAAFDKNTTAMKLVVDLVEPPKQVEQEEPRELTDDELMEVLGQFAARIDARRDQPKARA